MAGVITNCDRTSRPGNACDLHHSVVRCPRLAFSACFVSASPYHRHMSGSTLPNAPDRDGGADAWDILRRRLRPPALALSLYPPQAHRLGPAVCVLCRGPVRPGFARCYHCARHHLLGRDLLADAVVPISYAVKGTAFAAALWRYKSWPAPSAAAQASLRALLLAFLHDHGACVWRHAGMPAPGRLAVVPTGCGRPGPPPLLALAGSLPAAPGDQAGRPAGGTGPRSEREQISGRTMWAGSQCAAA